MTAAAITLAGLLGATIAARRALRLVESEDH